METKVYRPGAGHQPLYLAGRDPQLEAWRRSLGHLATIGRPGASDTIFVGPRGVGKTVLMSACAADATRLGFETISYQAAAGNDGLVAAITKRAAKQIEAEQSVWHKARRSFANLAGVSVGAAGVSASIALRTAAQEQMSRDPGDLADALADLAGAVTAERPSSGVLVTIDELQVAPPADLTLLAAALQRLNVEHPDAPVAFLATGLPHVPRSSSRRESPTPTGSSTSTPFRHPLSAPTPSSRSPHRP